MQRTIRIAIGLSALLLAAATEAQQPIIYPAKGQSPQLQQKDTTECRGWATQTTGVDPVALAQQGATQPG
ncbi:MAG: glycine zipper family protein, partial [Paraburkholderia sp.]